MDSGSSPVRCSLTFDLLTFLTKPIASGFFHMTTRPALVWFKNDLRLHNNETLVRAMESRQPLIALYVFDSRLYQPHPLGFNRTGSIRTNFLIQTITELKKNLSEVGVELIVTTGEPESLVPQIAADFNVSSVFTSYEAAYDERKILSAVEARLSEQKIKLHKFWTHTLYHPDDLPMPLEKLPDMFTAFRKAVEKDWIVRPTQKIPSVIGSFPVAATAIPSLEDFHLSPTSIDARSAVKYQGGETEALSRLNTYFWERDLLKHYKETRDQLIGEDYSSKFSAALSLGCISARTIYEEVKRYEQERMANESTYWLIFELLWRDYFYFEALKYGRKIFQTQGLKNKHQPFTEDQTLFEKWRTGTTGQPFIDANMKELLLTGFMSNRGRQNVASYLVHDLRLNWTWGAAWFESQLMDYDPCSNWLNWAYVAGVGNDPRPNRYFNTESQAARYDPEERYARLWNNP